MNLIEVPILVVGGGPVGISMAIALRHFSINCMVVEKHAGTLDFPKGRSIGIRTMEIFRQWGLESQVTEAGLVREESQNFFLGETLLGKRYQRTSSIVPETQNISPTDRLICSQEVLEPLLVRAAKEAGADVRFSTRLLSFLQDSTGVTAELVDSTGERLTVRCLWLVAADGARSPIRSTLGIKLQGPGVVGDSVSILIEADLKRRMLGRTGALYAVTQPRPGSMFGAVDNEKRWLFQLPRRPQDEPPEIFTDEKCRSLVRLALGDPDQPFSLLSHRLWQPTAQWAESFSQSRVFLIGDAVHVTIPSGGLGMNCGIADAHNLAWKLAAVLRGWASPTLLESYDQERRPAARATVEASLLIGAQARTFIARSLEDGLPDSSHPIEHIRQAIALPFGRGNGIALGLVYSSEAVMNDGSPMPDLEDKIFDYLPTGRPGHRAPHVWLEHGGRRLSTLDLFGHDFTLFIDAGPTSFQSAELLDGVGDIPLTIYTIGALAELSDPEDRWWQIYGINPGGWVLVRPDGYVCWRSARPPENGPADVIRALQEILART